MDKDPIIQKIEERFRVPERISDKIRNVAEKVRGGYVLFETRSQYNNPSLPWTKTVVFKMVFHNPSQKWKIYWMRGSGKWEYYDERKTLDGVLKVVKEDENGCFWG